MCGEQGGKSNEVPNGLGALDSKAGESSEIKNVEVDAKGEANNGLIGFFTDSKSGNYFMLVNVKRERPKR